MKKALDEIGWIKVWRFFWGQLQLGALALSVFPPLRAILLRMYGVHMGNSSIIHAVKFFNLYRRGFKGLTIGKHCFIGDDCLLDLATDITLEDQVTLAERVTILTHRNVGFKDHPLQQAFPAMEAPVVIREGSFVGAGVTILAGVTIGPRGFIAAGAVVTKSVGEGELAGGVPAKCIRRVNVSS